MVMEVEVKRNGKDHQVVVRRKKKSESKQNKERHMNFIYHHSIGSS